MYPDTNSVYCWTCGRAYDVVALVAEAEGLETMAAVKYIEDYAGVRWERQEADDDEFWRMVKKAQADPDDQRFWSDRDVILYRWAIHQTVLQLVEDPDWEGFDNAHLDVDALRAWRDEQLQYDLTDGKVMGTSTKEAV